MTFSFFAKPGTLLGRSPSAILIAATGLRRQVGLRQLPTPCRACRLYRHASELAHSLPLSEMNFHWNGGGWDRVDYRYAHVGTGVSFIY